MTTGAEGPADAAARERERILAETFGVITAALLEQDLDLVDVLDQLVVASMRLLEVAAVAVVLDDQRGGLVPVASSSEDSRLLELFQIRMDQGPCVDAVRDGETVVSADISAERERWPAFADAAAAVGFRSVVAVPMRLHGRTVGGLNLFGAGSGELSAERQRVGQSLADLATLAIFHQRSARRSGVLADQLQHALNSRVVIEQAKGRLAERYGIDTDAAFAQLRSFARNHNRRLGDVAAGVISGETDIGDSG